MDSNHLYGGYNAKRIWELDFIRGFCIILMIVDHSLYDLAYIFWYKWFASGHGAGVLFTLAKFARTVYYPLALRGIVWWLAVFCFVFICGMSCSFSHSNLKRGMKLAAVAIALTILTWGADFYLGQVNQFTIRFGVLHMLAASILLYYLLKNRSIILVLSISLLTIVAGIYFMNSPIITDLTIMGILVKTSSSFYSADYFPMMPWFGFFLLGAVLGPKVYPHKKSIFIKDSTARWQVPILFVGRHSLLFYLIHQPLIYGILTLLGYIVTPAGLP